jgi:hypothetical protein
MKSILKAENYFIQYRIKLLRGINTATMIIFDAFISIRIQNNIPDVEISKAIGSKLNNNDCWLDLYGLSEIDGTCIFLQ